MRIIEIESCKECPKRINHGCGAMHFEWFVCPESGIAKKCPLEKRKSFLFSFRDYWKNSSHQNIDDAIKGFLRTKKSKIK